MDIHPGSRLGSYEVVELIGEGGMGCVYRAHDTGLGRQVALKVVRSTFADDPDRLARFTREARLLASLNHPHIATIHGFEESEGVRFLVLELVAGVTLAGRLAQGPLPVDEALVLAAQIAAAVEAAHRHGIIHRDLKPANIKITPDGRVKVLDFGLAKPLAPMSGSASVDSGPTRSLSGTAHGTILGTAAYMSPEQARGREVDQRTDIWAFGCVLFDMLTGKPAFGSDTLPDTIVAVLTRDPDWSRLPPDVPVAIRRLLRRSLERDVQHRLHDMGDARLEIEDAMAARPEPGSAPAGEAVAAPTPRLNWGVLAGSILATALLTGSAVWMLNPTPAATGRPPVQFSLPVPVGERLDGLDFPAVALSPNETHVAFVASRGGQRRLFVRGLSTLEAQPLAGTEGAHGPFFSPDGEWIGFFAEGKLKKVRVAGGSVRAICDAPIGFGGAWASNGTIVYAPDNGSALWQVSAEGGAPQAITRLDATRGEFSHRWPELLPGDRAVLFTVGTEGSWDDAEIVVQSLESGERHTVVQGGTNPKFLPGGRLLYGRGGALFEAAFDARQGQVTAPAAEVLTGVLESSDGAMEFSVSRAGSVAYIAGGGDRASTLVWVDRQGNIQPLAAPGRAYSSPRLAPDGRTIAVTVAGAERDEVWTYDIAQNALTQLTFEGGSSPVWASDGRRIVFSATRGGSPDLFWKQADGSSPDERLTRTPHVDVSNSFSPGGRTLALVESDASARRDVLLLDLESGTVRPFLDSPANERAPAFSPDGHWVAYVSDESGSDEVYLAPITDARRRVIISAGGGSEPVWRSDGRELFFRSGARMMVRALGPGVRVEGVRVLFEGAFDAGAASRPAYDVSSDGARFLMVASSRNDGGPNEIRVALGWAVR